MEDICRDVKSDYYIDSWRIQSGRQSPHLRMKRIGWVVGLLQKPRQKQFNSATVNVKRLPQSNNCSRSWSRGILPRYDPSPCSSLRTTALRGNIRNQRKLQRSTECQEQAFEGALSALKAQTLAQYTDHNKPFHFQSNISFNIQFGAVLVQDDNSVALFSRKLNSALCNSTSTKNSCFLWLRVSVNNAQPYGCRELYVHTDHTTQTQPITFQH